MNRILDSSVGKVTGYWLESQDLIPGIARQAPVPTQPCVHWV
jgi:hypothetical protein